MEFFSGTDERMILLPDYNGKKVGVFGLGLSGDATVASLCASGAQVFAWDEKEEKTAACQQKHPQATYTDFRKWPWKELDTLVLSPGVPLHFPQPHAVVDVANVYGCEILGDIELLMQAQPQAKFVGITGTNGKSTTTALTGHLLRSVGAKVEVGGNIGQPALSLQPLGRGGIYVLEMSSYQIDLMLRSTFNIASLLNITPDHLDRHGDMEGYIAAKRRIFDGMGNDDTAIISTDDQFCNEIYKDMKSGKNNFSWQTAKPQLVALSVKEESAIDFAENPSLRGEHNRQNALAALHICKALGYPEDLLKDGFASFNGLPHRMQYLGVKDGVTFVNDSKATNADAVMPALKTYDDIYWILGGVAKEGGIDSLVEFFPKITHAYLIGEAAKDFAKVLKKHKVKYDLCGALDVAAQKAAEAAFEAGKGVVLLSPACASFDQFANFEQRGARFAAQVVEILSKRVRNSGRTDDAA